MLQETSYTSGSRKRTFLNKIIKANRELKISVTLKTMCPANTKIQLCGQSSGLSGTVFSWQDI